MHNGKEPTGHITESLRDSGSIQWQKPNGEESGKYQMGKTVVNTELAYSAMNTEW